MRMRRFLIVAMLALAAPPAAQPPSAHVTTSSAAARNARGAIRPARNRGARVSLIDPRYR